MKVVMNVMNETAITFDSPVYHLYKPRARKVELRRKPESENNGDATPFIIIRSGYKSCPKILASMRIYLASVGEVVARLTQ
jgi:hypothetical protein